MGVAGVQIRRDPVHHRDRGCGATGGFGERDGRVVATCDDHGSGQLGDGIGHSRDKADPGPVDPRGRVTDCHLLGRRQVRQHGERGQDLECARRQVLAVRVPRREHRATVGVGDEPCGGRDLRGRRQRLWADRHTVIRERRAAEGVRRGHRRRHRGGGNWPAGRDGGDQPSRQGCHQECDQGDE